MFTCRRDFGFLGRLFGVPRTWLSQVGAFCSSWSTEGRLLYLIMPALPDPGTAPIKLGIDEEALGEFVDGRLAGDVGEHPVDNTNASNLVDTTFVNGLGSSEVNDWESGGENGTKIQLFAVHKTEGRNSVLYPVNLTISKNGTVLAIDFVRTKGFLT